MLATTAAEAAKKAAEDKKSSTTDLSKLIAEPNIFDYKSHEEEIKAFREWSWVFEKYLSAIDEGSSFSPLVRRLCEVSARRSRRDWA